MKKYAVIDVGGSSIKYALMDEELNILDNGKVNNTFADLNEYTDAIAGIYNKYKDEVEGLACSMPGVLDPNNGFFYSGGAYEKYIHDINMIDELHKKIDCKIAIANDAKAAAYAELGYGCLKDINDAIVIVLGTGIGGCVIMNREVVNGKHFSAGEFSMITLNCTDDEYFKNIWATRNGSIGLLSRVNESLGENTSMDGIQIFERANNGDEKVIEGIRKFCKELAYQIYNLQVALDPNAFAIGGGISCQPLLMKLLHEELDKLLSIMPGYFGRLVPDVRVCKYNNDANLIGALYHFKELYEK